MNASGWVHRDVKPDNMLVNSAGELRIIDFAMAQRVAEAVVLRQVVPQFLGTMVQGTRSYMSPEQIRGESLDGRADIYSFGATLYELVAFRPPFRADSLQELLQKQILEKPAPPSSLVPDLTPEFSDLVVKCLAKKRDDRPASFHDVLKTLNHIRVYKNDPAKDPK